MHSVGGPLSINFAAPTEGLEATRSLISLDGAQPFRDGYKPLRASAEAQESASADWVRTQKFSRLGQVRQGHRETGSRDANPRR